MESWIASTQRRTQRTSAARRVAAALVAALVAAERAAPSSEVVSAGSGYDGRGYGSADRVTDEPRAMLTRRSSEPGVVGAGGGQVG